MTNVASDLFIMRILQYLMDKERDQNSINKEGRESTVECMNITSNVIHNEKP